MDSNQPTDTPTEENLRQAQAACFHREDLFPLIERAEILAKVTPNPRWKRAYENLAQAASTIDAFIARSTVCGCKVTMEKVK